MYNWPRKGLDLWGDFWFSEKFGLGNGIEFEKLDKATKKDFIVNKFEEYKYQAFELTTKGAKYTELSEDISLSRSSIYISVRLWRKLKFQEKDGNYQE